MRVFARSPALDQAPPARPHLRLQPKLTVNAPGDAYEREADRVAQRAAGAPACACGGACPRCAGGGLAHERPTLRRAGQDASAGAEAPPVVHEVLGSPGRPLDPGVRSFFGSRLGHDFGGVRVHTGARAAESARAVGASAYTVGRDVVFGDGEYAPETASGQRLIAHELAHVVQQSGADASAATVQRAPPRKKAKDKQAPSAADIVVATLGISHDVLTSPFGALIPPSARLVMAALVNVDFAILLVERIRTGTKPTIAPDDEKAFRLVVSLLSPADRKELEKRMLLWLEFGHIWKMTRMIRIVTGFDRKSNEEESRRGKFSEKEGGEIKERLGKATAAFGLRECLDFLYSASLDLLFADEEPEREEAKRLYGRGATQREDEEMERLRKANPEMTEEKEAEVKKNITHARTLSRLASELRLQGLVGPVTIVPWKGGANGAHTMDPADVFDRLSGDGTGWYFFLCSVISIHTFIIAVHVLPNGKRKYFEIQGGQIEPKTRKGVRTFFDKFENEDGAFSRIWQVYLRPTG